MRRLSALAIALLLAGCSSPEPAPTTEAPSASQPASGGSSAAAPVAHPGARELGFAEPSASLTLDMSLAHVAEESVIYIDPATVGSASIDVAEVSFDGQEQWRHPVAVPEGTEPRMSIDSALGVVGVWFTPDGSEERGAMAPLASPVTWFAAGSGESGTIEAGEGEGVWAQQSIVGYELMAADADPQIPSAFVFLGQERQERRVERDEIGEPFNVIGVWGGSFWGMLGREGIVAETGVLARMAPETRYGFWAGTSHFHVNSLEGHVKVFDKTFAPVFEATNQCAAGMHGVTIALGKVTVGSLVGDLEKGTTECVELPEGYEIGTVAPDGWAIIKQEGRPEAPETLPEVKVGRLGVGAWTDLPAGTAPRFSGGHAVFVSPSADGDWSGATLSAYPIDQFAPPSQ